MRMLLVFCAITLCLGATAIAGEPRFKGRKASAWADRLQRLYDGDDSDARIRGVRNLKDGGTNSVPVLVWILEEAAERWTDRHGAATLALSALMQMEADAASATPAVIRMLDAPGTLARSFAAGCLGAIGPEARQAVPRLTQSLEDPDPGVRASAAKALGQIGADASPAVSALLRRLDTATDASERVWAAFALGRIASRPADCVPALTRAVQDTDRDVRLEAVRALRAFPQNAPASPLANAFAGQDMEIRLEAAATLQALGPRAVEAVPQLSSALADDSTDLRIAAADALGAVGPGAASAVRALVDGVRDKDRNVRASFLRAVGRIGGPAEVILPGVERSLRRGPSAVRAAAASAVGSARGAPDKVLELLSSACRDSSAQVRRSAAAALGAADVPRDAARGLLESLQKDADAATREVAADTLRRVTAVAGPLTLSRHPLSAGDELTLEVEERFRKAGSIDGATLGKGTTVTGTFDNTNQGTWLAQVQCLEVGAGGVPTKMRVHFERWTWGKPDVHTDTSLTGATIELTVGDGKWRQTDGKTPSKDAAWWLDGHFARPFAAIWRFDDLAAVSTKADVSPGSRWEVSPETAVRRDAWVWGATPEPSAGTCHVTLLETGGEGEPRLVRLQLSVEAPVAGPPLTRGGSAGTRVAPGARLTSSREIVLRGSGGSRSVETQSRATYGGTLLLEGGTRMKLTQTWDRTSTLRPAQGARSDGPR